MGDYPFVIPSLLLNFERMHQLYGLNTISNIKGKAINATTQWSLSIQNSFSLLLAIVVIASVIYINSSSIDHHSLCFTTSSDPR